MAVPTVLIGCLPTYAHVGVAAPVLLSLLRLVQGVAMGGEFGSALVRGVSGVSGHRLVVQQLVDCNTHKARNSNSRRHTPLPL
jgi:hypothetical protein